MLSLLFFSDILSTSSLLASLGFGRFRDPNAPSEQRALAPCSEGFLCKILRYAVSDIPQNGLCKLLQLPSAERNSPMLLLQLILIPLHDPSLFDICDCNGERLSNK